MKTCYDIVKTLVRTEKGTELELERKYLFDVATTATKPEIKRAIEEIYNVKVDAVNTMTMPRKKKRVRREQGFTTAWKKAVVTLSEGQKIEVT